MTNTKWWWTNELLGLTVRQLEARLLNAEKFAEKYPQFEYGQHNEYRHELKRLIAEKIGR